MKHLNWEINDIPFVTRETDRAGQTVPFRCGRDFLYYALHFYQKVPTLTHPSQLESTILGTQVPQWGIWTMLHMKLTLSVLEDSDLCLKINERLIGSWFSLVYQLAIPRRVSYETVLREIEQGIAHNYVVGIDIAISLFGLVDHVLFVYGYDEDNIYLLDTHQVTQLQYEKILPGDKFLMKLSKQELTKKLSIWSRIWTVVPRETYL